MGVIKKHKNWLGIVRKKLFRPSSHRETTLIVLHTITTTSSFRKEEATVEDQVNGLTSATDTEKEMLSQQDIAAVKIQSHFRRHLARRAFRALRSLVKLQAVVRGVLVRRQARIAFDCMHALARLQLAVRARQLLNTCAAQ